MDLGRIDATFSEMRQEQQKKDEELNVWKEQIKNLMEKQESERKEMIAMLEIRDERVEKLEQGTIRPGVREVLEGRHQERTEGAVREHNAEN